MVQRGLGNPKVTKYKKPQDKFNNDTHTRCWKKYEVRPLSGDANPFNTKTQYCIYDEPTEQYRYTYAWVDFLIEKMKIDEEYNSLYKKGNADSIN